VTHGVVISPDSKFAFVTVEGIGSEPGSVDVIDLSSLKLVDQADIGKQAGGIAFWKMEN
jgi:DNA-binding beta-propeller fold protein YncE